MKRSLTLYIIVGIDVALSFICFKQLWAPGAEARSLKISYVLFQPFIQLYALIGIWTVSKFIFQKTYNQGGQKKISYLSVLFFPAIFLVLPVCLIFTKTGFKMGAIMVWGFLDPIKANYFFGSPLNHLKKRTIILFVGSFLLLFISVLASKLNGIDDSDWPFFMGGFFYLFMAWLDTIYQYNTNKK